MDTNTRLTTILLLALAQTACAGVSMFEVEESLTGTGSLEEVDGTDASSSTQGGGVGTGGAAATHVSSASSFPTGIGTDGNGTGESAGEVGSDGGPSESESEDGGDSSETEQVDESSGDLDDSESEDTESGETGDGCTDEIRAAKFECLERVKEHVRVLLGICRDDLRGSLNFVDTDGLSGNELVAALEHNDHLERMYACRNDRECFNMNSDVQDDFAECENECMTEPEIASNQCYIDSDDRLTVCFLSSAACLGDTEFDKSVREKCYATNRPVLKACLEAAG